MALFADRVYMNNRPLVISTIDIHQTGSIELDSKIKRGNPRVHVFINTIGNTSNSKSLLNEGRPNKRKDDENSLAVLTVE